MSARLETAPERLRVLPALADAAVSGYAGRRLIAVYYAVNLVVTTLVAVAVVLLGVLSAVDGNPLGWLAVVVGPILCFLFLLAVRLRLEVAAARFDVRDDVAAIRRRLEEDASTG